jgi:hypothetical protein
MTEHLLLLLVVSGRTIISGAVRCFWRSISPMLPCCSNCGPVAEWERPIRNVVTPEITQPDGR